MSRGISEQQLSCIDNAKMGALTGHKLDVEMSDECVQLASCSFQAKTDLGCMVVT